MKKGDSFNLLIAGFGGQGVLLMGDLLAWAGMMEGYSTSFFPSYGVEMRGGTVNCIVVMTKGELYSPVLGSFQNMVVMNLPSLEKYLPSLRENGTLFYNSSLIGEDIVKKKADRVKVIGVPLNDLAKNLDPRVINMVMLGCVVETTKVVKESTLLNAVSEYFKGKPESIKINQKGIEVGIEYIRKSR